jgi:hypothetical protein
MPAIGPSASACTSIAAAPASSSGATKTRKHCTEHSTLIIDLIYLLHACLTQQVTYDAWCQGNCASPTNRQGVIVLTAVFVLGGSLFAFSSPAVCQPTSVHAGKQCQQPLPAPTSAPALAPAFCTFAPELNLHQNLHR